MSRPSDAQLRAWYVDDEMPLRTIAGQCGVRVSTVSGWIRQAGLPQRSRANALRIGQSRDFHPGDTVLLSGTNDRAVLVADHGDILTLRPAVGGTRFEADAADWEHIDPDTPPLPIPDTVKERR